MELAPHSHARHTDERPAGTPPGTEAFPHLFAPLMLRGRRLRNRIVMTAHTTSMGVDGIPGDRAAAYYAERARGGAGLIVVEPIPVHPTARVTPDNFTAQDPRYVPALGELAATVRGHGCALIQQLYHVGPYANPLASRRERWGPSPTQPLGAADRVHAMTRREIRELVTSFASAAATVAAAELDGVEVLMGHDGLIDSFLSPLHNHRADEYGGPARNRLRLAREVLDAVRSAVGDRILGVSLSGDHFSAGGLHADDCAEIAATLVDGHDVDYVAVTNAGYLAAHLIIPTMDVDPGFGDQFARAVKHALPGTPVLAQGRITTPQLAESLLAGGACDLVGMTRALIADPYLPTKARTGRTAEIRPCIGCNQQCWGRRARQFFISCLRRAGPGCRQDAPARRIPRCHRLPCRGNPQARCHRALRPARHAGPGRGGRPGHGRRRHRRTPRPVRLAAGARCRRLPPGQRPGRVPRRGAQRSEAPTW
jgi:2,4-dienoyl-CoA reductase-like NADH-dependent reductase (Old Yellow Enzyme family)